MIGSAVTVVPWIRVHPIGKSAIYFGKSANNRFTPENSPFGVWYVAEDLHTALFESFGDEMIENDRRNIEPLIGTNLLGELSILAEADKFLDDYEVIIV